MTTERLVPEFIESGKDSMNPGTLYVSIEYGTCGHLCACGCGNEVITPLSPAQWAFTYDGKNASLRPSIGNWSLPCKSHYIVDRGNIRWARTFSDLEIARNRERDRAVLERGDDDHRYGVGWPESLRDVDFDGDAAPNSDGGGAAGDRHDDDDAQRGDDHPVAADGGGGFPRRSVTARPAGRLRTLLQGLSVGRKTI
jgi:hypothetical protein